MGTENSTDRISCPQRVLDLVARFGRHIEAYKHQTYNETQVRREFIDPLFTALGWDVDNKEGLAEAYKDVIHEDAIKIGGTTKAPDYCFRIGGTRKFFVEAKKPAVPLKEHAESAYQLRRYAWSAKLPLSILTDFEELTGRDYHGASDRVGTLRIRPWILTVWSVSKRIIRLLVRSYLFPDLCAVVETRDVRAGD